MPELDTLTVKGFKSIASIENLHLGAVNILIGPNGSGKSNFIGIFSFLHAIREGQLQEYVLRAGGANKILHFGSSVTKQLDIHISFQEGRNQYGIELRPTDLDELVPFSETAYFWDKIRFPERPGEYGLFGKGKEAGISNAESRGVAAYVRRHLDGWRLYHFHDTSTSSPMKRTSDVNDNHFLRPDGSNLAPFLYFLSEKKAESYNLIRNVVQRVAPFFDDFQLAPQNLNPEKIRLEWKHVGSDAYFDASSLSDGTLRFISLAALFLQPKEYLPSVILVDEPEIGLHPYAIEMLASLIHQTPVQVIVSTQSSLLLDHFQPEDVLVADRVEGNTQFTRLESSNLEKWLDEYSLGQLWEKNTLGGRPGIEKR